MPKGLGKGYQEALSRRGASEEATRLSFIKKGSSSILDPINAHKTKQGWASTHSFLSIRWIMVKEIVFQVHHPSPVRKKRSTGINQDLDQRVDVWAVWVRCDTTGGEHSC